MQIKLPFVLPVFLLLTISCNLFAVSQKKVDVPDRVAPTASMNITEAASDPAVVTQTVGKQQEPEELRIVFIGPDRNLYSWTNSTGSIVLQGTGDVSDVKISQDGIYAAFVRSNETPQYSLWIVNTIDRSSRQVMSWIDLAGLKSNPDSLGTSPANLQWIPGTHQLTFSSREVFEGPGMVLNNDLIVVEAESGMWSYRFKPGEGGVATFSPDGTWMAISTPEKITIMELNGNPVPGALLEFTPVITYSEYQYYPQPVWATTGQSMAVFIPASDPLAEPRQPGSIWTMDTKGGNPVLRRQVTPNFLGPVTLEPDESKFFYLAATGKPEENWRELRTGWFDSQKETVIAMGEVTSTYDWNPDNTFFLYKPTSDSPIYLCDMGARLGPINGTEQAHLFEWVDSKSYLFSTVNNSNVELHLKTENKGSLLVAALPESKMFRMVVDFSR